MYSNAIAIVKIIKHVRIMKKNNYPITSELL